MSLDHVLLIGAIVALVAVLAARLGSRFGLPSLLLFLGVGMVMAPMGFDLDDANLAHSLGFAALVFILAEGGLTTRWEDVKRAWGIASLLATLGVAASVGAVTVFAHLVLGLPLVSAALLGAITAPTDSAAVFSVLRHVPLPPARAPSLRGSPASTTPRSCCWWACSPRSRSATRPTAAPAWRCC